MARFLFYDDKLINLMLEDEKPCGGAAVQTYGWIRGLLEEGQEVLIMTETTSTHKLKEECRNIRLVPMFDRRKGMRFLRWFYYRIPFTYKQIKAAKADYLYISIPAWPNLLIGIMCRMLDIKLIQRISNDNQVGNRFRKNQNSVKSYFLNWVYRFSHHILCQNNFQLHEIKKKFPGKSAIKIFNPLYLKNHELGDDHRAGSYIAWLGVYRHQKNLKRLYQVASILRKEQFLVAGKEGANCDAETLEYLQKLQQLPNVKFTGYLQRAEVLPYLANARFLLNTSHYEGFSNTFLESLSVGTPVLSGVNVNPDSVISNNNLGIIYDDVFDLCKQYTAITPELYQLMSEKAREYVARNHSYRVLARRLLRYLSETDNIISGRDGRMLPLADHTTQEIAT